MTDVWELNVVLLVAVKNEWEAVIDYCTDTNRKFEYEIYWVEKEEIHNDLRLKGIDKRILEIKIPNGLVVRMIIMKLPGPGSGGDAASYLASKAIEIYQPHTICMVGMCAGHPGRTEKGDVILASTIVRHDYGDLNVAADEESGPELLNKLVFEHRGEILKIDNSNVYTFTNFKDLLNTYKKDKKPAFNVKMGAISTCNQVTKIPKVFDYIQEKIFRPISGAEEEWQLHALEMEAFPVAYSAMRSLENVGWVIVKGVADFADINVDKAHQSDAIKNSLDFLFWFLPRVVKESFSEQRPERSRSLPKVNEAKDDYQQGDFGKSAAKFNQLYEAGCRSIDVRKHYIKCLERYGDYELAICKLKAYSLRPWTNDAVSVELLAEIYWRQGNYNEMHNLLEARKELETSQILYLRALCLIFRSAAHKTMQENELSIAVQHLQQAVSRETRQPKFFLNVNLCFALKLQVDLYNSDKTVLDNAYKEANKIITYDLNTYQKRGLLYVYKLLLLAIVDKKSEFKEFKNTNDSHHLILALDNMDMIYKRIEILYPNNTEKLKFYLGELSYFIIRNRQIGKFVREETERKIHEHR